MTSNTNAKLMFLQDLIYDYEKTKNPNLLTVLDLYHDVTVIKEVEGEIEEVKINSLSHPQSFVDSSQAFQWRRRFNFGGDV